MGVDFFPCDSCGESICDCGTYYSCKGCGRRWCDEKCALEHGVDVESEEYQDSGEGTCKFCKNEDVDDETLLTFILKHFKTSKAKAKKLYMKSIKNT